MCSFLQNALLSSLLSLMTKRKHLRVIMSKYTDKIYYLFIFYSNARTIERLKWISSNNYYPLLTNPNLKSK